jgi:hypothetical protein
MKPRINEQLVDRLLQAAEARKLAENGSAVEKQTSSPATNTQPSLAKANGHQPANVGAQKPPSQKAGPMAPYKVSVLVSVSDSVVMPGIGIIRSQLSGDVRQILVTLNKRDPLLGKALERLDTLFVKFGVALLLAEWVHFWSNTHEGRLVGVALRKAAEISPGVRLWWSGLASTLSKTSLLTGLAKLPIYGPTGQLIPQSELFTLEVTLRRDTQILGWQHPERRQRRSPTSEITERPSNA